MTATTAQTVTVDRELLHTLLIEARGVAEVMEALVGASEPELTRLLFNVAGEVAQAAGFFPADDVLMAYSNQYEAEHPLLARFWDEGEARRDELLGRTPVAVAS